jgi:hypothetical protein
MTLVSILTGIILLIAQAIKKGYELNKEQELTI